MIGNTDKIADTSAFIGCASEPTRDTLRCELTCHSPRLTRRPTALRVRVATCLHRILAHYAKLQHCVACLYILPTVPVAGDTRTRPQTTNSLQLRHRFSSCLRSCGLPTLEMTEQESQDKFYLTARTCEGKEHVLQSDTLPQAVSLCSESGLNIVCSLENLLVHISDGL